MDWETTTAASKQLILGHQSYSDGTKASFQVLGRDWELGECFAGAKT